LEDSGRQRPDEEEHHRQQSPVQGAVQQEAELEPMSWILKIEERSFLLSENRQK
jgi:hypothetical protein